jgi:hypothetical protein
MTARAVSHVSCKDAAQVSGRTHGFLNSVPSIQTVLFVQLCVTKNECLSKYKSSQTNRYNSSAGDPDENSTSGFTGQ